MNKVLTTAGALLMTTTVVNAAGLDRSGQGIGSIFETGTYFELSYGNVNPNVSGVLNVAPSVESGDVAPAYNQTGMAFKSDVNDQLSFGIILDQPFGASVNYPDTTDNYPLEGVNANVSTTGVTVLARYKLNDAISVHAGLRQVSASGNIQSAVPSGAYLATFESGSGSGYVVGAAYEKPEIALRLALTYSSAIDISMPTTEQLQANAFAPQTSDTEVTLPQSINLDFQTGIAANTLLMASVRWADWTSTVIQPAEYGTATGGGNLLDYDNDGLTYSLGVGRRLSDSLSASVTYGWEKANNDPTAPVGSNLSPTDGYKSIQVGAAYTISEGVELSGGVRYVWVGDSSTEPFAPGPMYGIFTDNSAVAVGMKLSVNF